MTIQQWIEVFAALRTLKGMKMPDDNKLIGSVIEAAPKPIQPQLKFFAARMFYKKTSILYPFSLTVDTTLACNFACPGCYLAEDLIAPSKENIDKGMAIQDWERKFEGLHTENPFLSHASWVGGEPTLRKDLLTNGVRHFLSNWIHTNGYLPLPTNLGDEHHRVTFVVSIDGYKETHDRMRPTRGGRQPTYDRVLANIRNSEGLTVMVHTVVSLDNLASLPKLVEDLRTTQRVKSMGFSLISPPKGSSGFAPAQRDAIIDQLMKLRRTYGTFIWSTPSILKRMRSDRINDTCGEGCRIKAGANGTGATISFDAYGAVKEQCVMGKEQSCADCGCAIPAQYASLFNDTFRGELEITPWIGGLFDYVRL
jgi:MoaA/NifB/PqqE/SkfB family radical SAM enzyme